MGPSAVFNPEDLLFARFTPGGGVVKATGTFVRRAKIVSQNALFVNHSLTNQILSVDNYLDLMLKTIIFHKY